jgi:hypothetical protein
MEILQRHLRQTESNQRSSINGKPIKQSAHHPAPPSDSLPNDHHNNNIIINKQVGETDYGCREEK